LGLIRLNQIGVQREIHTFFFFFFFLTNNAFALKKLELLKRAARFGPAHSGFVGPGLKGRIKNGLLNQGPSPARYGLSGRPVFLKKKTFLKQ
jgi:hypothetical protein